MTKWTNIVDLDVAWARAELGARPSINQITQIIARERGHAFADQEIRAALRRDAKAGAGQSG